ncbi:hypothetical protein PSPO01_08810 [Paraphaeosphaeria sporulosa]
MEFVGAIAALTQLAKYGFELANSIPETRRRLRHAPTLLREWNDRASLLASLAETLQNQPALVPRVQPEIIARLVGDVRHVASLLQDLAVATEDGKMVRVKKRVHIIRKERDINKALGSIGHLESALQAQILFQPGPPVTARPSVGITIGLPQRNPHFVGHNALLQRLTTKLNNPNGTSVVLTGLGGTGKTAVAIELLHSLLAEDPQTSVFWVDGTTGPSLLASCRVLSQDDKTIAYPGTVSEALAALRTRVCKIPSRCIVVLDSVDVTTVLPEALKILVEGSGKFRTVITTRNLRFALRLVHPKNVEEISCLALSDATHLLLSYTLPVFDDMEKATCLARALKCHPFAVIDAGVCIRLGNSPTLLPPPSSSFPGPDFSQYTAHQIGSYEESSGRSTISMEALTSQNATSIPLLLCLACFHETAGITMLLSDLVKTRENQDALALLRAYYLFESETADVSLRLNRFVRQEAKARLAQYHNREKVIDLAMRAVSTTTFACGEALPDRDLHQASVLCTAFEVTKVDELHASCVQRWIKMALSLCERLIILGDLSYAIHFIAQTIAWATASTGHAPDLVRNLRSLFELAARTIREAVQYQPWEVGSCDVNTVHSLNNLGLAHQGQGLFEDAERYHRQALNIKQHLFGRRHPETFLTMNNLALSLQSQNKHDNARAIFEMALRGRKMLLGAHSLDVQISMSNLGVSYLIQKQYSEALDLFQRALEGIQRFFNQDHPEVLKCKGNIALTKECQGLSNEAVVWLLDISSVQKSTLAEAHPDTLKTLRNIATILHRQGEYEKAEAVVRESLALEETKYGRGDSRTFVTLQHLSSILHEQMKFEEALDIAMWLYESRREKLGDSHASTVCSFEHIKELEGEIWFSRLEHDIFTFHGTFSHGSMTK